MKDDKIAKKRQWVGLVLPCLTIAAIMSKGFKCACQQQQQRQWQRQQQEQQQKQQAAAATL